MPELPEVETVKRGLERTILGKTVEQLTIRVKKLFPDEPELIDQVLVGAKILAVQRRAKILLLDLSTDWTLAIHLKMTGQLIVVSPELQTNEVAFVGGHPEKAYDQPLPHRHTHISLSLTDRTIVHFNDLRKFGWWRLFPRAIIDHPGHQSLENFLESLNLGPEPFSSDFSLSYFQNLLNHRSIPIKQLLLEQTGIAGIGNIYADEALFRAGIRPTRKAIGLKRLEIRKLHEAIRHVLEMGIKFGGTSKNTYRNVEGTKGEMQYHLMVYQRTGEPCKVCGTAIERLKIGQRSSHFCPKCQQ